MDETEAITEPAPERAERRRQAQARQAQSRARTGLVALAVVAILAIGAWFLLRDDDKPDSTAQATPVAASTSDLRALATDVKHPVYWAGQRPGNTYELTRTGDGRIYIRYLPQGVAVGDPSPKYTTVGTYPQANAYDATVEASKRQGARAYNTKSGALVVTSSATPTSVYFAFKGLPYLVEVFDPSAAKALGLALSGKVRLVR